jgi:hypothetical protein
MSESSLIRTAVVVACLLGMSAVVVPASPIVIARTGFESSEGYVAGNTLRGQPGSTSPMPDGIGWGSNNWAGEGTTNSGNSGSTLFMPVISNAAMARSGAQYAVIHGDVAPNTGDNRIRRKYDTSLIQNGRVGLGASVRLDTDAAEYAANGKWFASSFNMYLEYGTSSPNPSEGKQNLRIEFARDTGQVNLKVAGSSVNLGLWTDPASGVCAKDTWLDVLLEADIAAQRVDVYMNGVNRGNYAFNVNLGSGESLNQVRFQGPRNYSGYRNSGVSIDNVSLTTTPEPGLAMMSIVAAGLLVRRRTGS